MMINNDLPPEIKESVLTIITYVLGIVSNILYRIFTKPKKDNE